MIFPPARPSIAPSSNAMIKRHAAETLSPLRGYLIVQRSPGACAPGYFLTPLRGWRGTPPINTTAMAQQACRQKWLSTPAFSREAAKESSPGRKPWVGIDKRKALKGRKKFDATFR